MESSIDTSQYDAGEDSRHETQSLDPGTALSYTQTPITSTLKTELASNGASLHRSPINDRSRDYS